MKLSKIVSTLVLLVVLSTSVVYSQNSSDYINQSLKDWADSRNCGKENKEVCAEGYFQFAVNSMMYSFADSIGGVGSSLVAKTPEEKRVAIQGSALGQVGSLMGGMYANPPASGVYYAYDAIQNAGFAKSAYAQGIGYSALSPIQDLWKVFRNISYIILVIVLVVIGFMIMFRMKINAQTAITIQNAIPNIIITLIVITFSYAIAGLVIDLMYFFLMTFIAIVHSFLCSDTGANCFAQADTATLQAQYINGGVGTLFGKVFSTIPDSVAFSGGVGVTGGVTGGVIGMIVWLTGGIAAPLVLMGGLAAAIGAAVSGATLQEGTLSLFSGAISPFLLLLMILALLFVFVRIFFVLMNAYIQIVISIIFSPIILLFGAIPGQNAFGSWFLGLLGNIMVFPTVAVLLIIANALSYPSAQPLWTPPLLGGPVGSVVGGFVQPLIGFGIAMLVPTLVNSMKELFKAKPVLPITPGMVLSPMLGGMQTAGQTFMSYGYLRTGLSGLTGMFKPSGSTGGVTRK